ncbi:membrane protein insertion efficiency factor YidD [bacterium]|nr:membrane protein insertion efficiency factor YidD [bacterium]
MKDILLYLIKTYKKFPHAGKCRFVPTCSTYAYDAISKYGCIKGSILSIKRFIKCNPWNKTEQYDPVPELFLMFQNSY